MSGLFALGGKMKLIFKSIKNESIFGSDFENLSESQGTIEFKHMHTPGGLAVVYAPNGTGKSSFTRVVSSEKSTANISFLAEDETGNSITPENGAFHTIKDQINRNVIGGKETDYLVGAQIRREYELRDSINSDYSNAINMLVGVYKNEFKVSKVGDLLLNHIPELEGESFQKAYLFVKSIVNSRSRGKDINQNEFVEFIRNESNRPIILDYDEEKRLWLIRDINENNSIVKQIMNIEFSNAISNNEILQIERHDTAIGVLRQYSHLDTCVVCDNQDFNGEELLARKEADRVRIYENLDEKTREILDLIIEEKRLVGDDPFEIKNIINDFLSNGNCDIVEELKSEIRVYLDLLAKELVEKLFHSFDNTEFFTHYDEYQSLIQTQPTLDSEELLFIEDVINENIGKDITIERDEESKNYKLKLGNKDLLETDRSNMELSSGEQNFISLAFELLLARHSNKEYVVLDDPISSFDSIYKNKIAFCIIKFLEGKKQIVLTHNTDLIRLLDVQLNNCFNLYILNNSENGTNGFIPVSDKEKKLLINLHELVKFFQNKNNELESAIINRRFFLMSMIPFMRGYAHISLDDDDDFGTLSNIMHGYLHGSVNAALMYKKFFGYDFGESEEVSTDDIINIDCEQICILNENEFPLLANTLKQTLIYYHLRMVVEKQLVDYFSLNVRDETLSQIICKAFYCQDNDPDFEIKRRFRVFFTSRKTLLNEFNHFEGNMNIFQPAIDITYPALQKEINDINQKLDEVRQYVGQ